jgi:cold shock CspA family protein
MVHHPVSAWMSTGTKRSTSTRTTSGTLSTRLHMFDWLSQPAKPRPTSNKDHDNHDDHDDSHSPNRNPFKEAEDFVSHWFQGFQGIASTSHEPVLRHPEHEEDPVVDHVVVSTASPSSHSTTTTAQEGAATTGITAAAVGAEVSSTDDQKKDRGVEEGALGTLSPTHRVAATDAVAAAPDVKIHSGHVAWFDANKGYGFLLVDDDNDNKEEENQGGAGNGVKEDIFVHFSAISTNSQQAIDDNDDDSTKEHDGTQGGGLWLFRKLLRNEPVEFQLITTAGGRKKAVHVTGPHGAPVQYIQQQMIRRTTTIDDPADATHHHKNNNINIDNHPQE